MPITSGVVRYSKTIQESQFEPKKAEVEISFTVGEGEVLADILDEAKDIARQEALDLVKQRDRRG
jgi:hypothetical protein